MCKRTFGPNYYQFVNSRQDVNIKSGHAGVKNSAGTINKFLQTAPQSREARNEKREFEDLGSTIVVSSRNGLHFMR